MIQRPRISTQASPPRSRHLNQAAGFHQSGSVPKRDDTIPIGGIGGRFSPIRFLLTGADPTANAPEATLYRRAAKQKTLFSMRSARLCGVASPCLGVGLGSVAGALRITSGYGTEPWRDVGCVEDRLVEVWAAGLSRAAMSASGALNRPRRSPGGRTASMASSFSDGSTRR